MVSQDAILEEIAQIASITEDLMTRLEEEAKEEAERQRIRAERVEKEKVNGEQEENRLAFGQEKISPSRIEKISILPKQRNINPQATICPPPSPAYAATTPFLQQDERNNEDYRFSQVQNAMNELRGAILEQRLRVQQESRQQLSASASHNRFEAQVCNFLNDFRGVLDAERAKASEDFSDSSSSDDVEMSENRRTKKKGKKRKECKKKGSKKAKKVKKVTAKKIGKKVVRRRKK